MRLTRVRMSECVCVNILILCCLNYIAWTHVPEVGEKNVWYTLYVYMYVIDFKCVYVHNIT